MKLRTYLGLGSAALAGLLACPAQALDLRPRYHTSVFDGIVVRRPYFADGERKFGVITDGETEVTEAGEGAMFRFRTIRMATVSLTKSPLSVDLPFAGETLERYRAGAVGLLPSDAREVVLEQRAAEPLPVNGWRSYRFVFTYRHGTGQMRESITFLNLSSQQQIVVRAAARLQDWEELASRADDIMVRWHEIRPGDGTDN